MRTTTIPVLIFLIAFFSTCEAQVTVYQTYSDWKNQKPGRTYFGYVGAGHAMGKPYGIFQVEKGERDTEKEKEFWGFTSGEDLYRLDKDAGRMHRVVHMDIQGSVCLWHLKDADKMKEGQDALSDFLCYLTEGVNGEIIAMPHGLNSWSGIGIGSYKRFIKEGKDSKYRKLCDCLEHGRDVKTASDCIEQYNTEHPPKEEH